MIGLGKWQATIDNMFFKGNAVFTISDNSGEYGIEIELPGSDIDIPEIKVHDVVEDGDTLSAKANVSLLPGKDIDVSLTFTDDVCNGYIKAPFVGKIKIKDAKKV